MSRLLTRVSRLIAILLLLFYYLFVMFKRGCIDNRSLFCVDFVECVMTIIAKLLIQDNAYKSELGVNVDFYIVVNDRYIVYHRFLVHFPVGLDFLFITFLQVIPP